MPELSDFLRGYPPFEDFLERCAAAESAAAGEEAKLFAPSFVHPFLTAALAERRPWRAAPLLVVTANQDAAMELEHELALYLPGRPVLYLPPRGVWYGSEGEVQPRVAGRRARAVTGLAAAGGDATWAAASNRPLRDDASPQEGDGYARESDAGSGNSSAIAATEDTVSRRPVRSGGRDFVSQRPPSGPEPPVVIVEATTLLEGVIPPARPPLTLAAGSRVDFDTLLRELVSLGYTRVDQVEDAGEFSVRGGLIDVFPATERYPVRVEFWGDEVESLRSFSVYSQRSLGPLESVRLHAAAEDPDGAPVNLLTLLPEGTHVVRLDPARARARVEAFENEQVEVLGAAYSGDEYEGWPQIEERLAALPVATLDSLGIAAADAEAPEAATFRAGSGELPVTNLAEAEEAMRRLVDDGYRVVITFEGRSDAERAGGVLRRTNGRVVHGGDVPEGPGVSFLPLGLRRHFLIPEIKLALLTDAQVFPRRHKAVRRPTPGVTLSSFRDLRKGDYVVHEDHGVGRFDGISTKSVAGVTRDYLDLAYKDGDMLYIPHDQIGKVMRYVGSGGADPGLSKLGGKAWENLKSRVRRAARQVAGELLHLYALRQATKGFGFSEDTEWQIRFEKAFPYEETEDQLRAIDAVKDDMESDQPMDRLLCGDVGYGKTEVALRAAFKAVQDSKQVMVLVPTTILAQQHYGTFRERMADFPVKVEMISRFRSAAEQKKIIKDFSEGKVDILIGTHRLLSQDVKPKDLGLVIVDEEQRFGVAHKEALRRLKLRVDVLTLTATPIPRTLQMSLSGVRDITVIETPPRDRHPIQTYVGLHDEGMVERAIEREIDRAGQVYYLHNRVETIDKAALKLRTAMPKVRFAVAHGQMPEQELEKVMLDFLRGDQDVLVSTTIIESGLDIPNANTLIVERADLLGLAQLYQIRGRIGRSTKVAHAFLFHPDEAALTEEAVARLSTLADYTELGSGFKIAMRDLEIRGAGELLGEEQSGQIAAVGFEMYLSMLEEATRQLQGEEAPQAEKYAKVDVGIDAYVPADFIGYEAARVDLHRRIASAKSLDELTDLRAELTDRFGELPEPVENLIFLGEVRVRVQELGADSLSARQDRLTMSGVTLPAGSRERLQRLTLRYTYAPVQGQLTRTFKPGARSVRENVQTVLDDILRLSTAEVDPNA